MNVAHWHLILNHIPVLGTAFGLVVLGAGLWKAGARHVHQSKNRARLD